jgi:hypothetical protein
MSSFLDNYRNVRETEKANQESLDQYNKALDAFVKDYNSHKAKGAGKTVKDLSDAIKRLGIAEGKISNDSSDGDIARYGISILDDLNNDSEVDFETYVKEQGTDEQRNAYKNLKEAYEKYPKVDSAKPANNLFEAIGNGIYEGAQGFGNLVGGIFNSPYYARAALHKGEWESTINNMQKDYEDYNKSIASNKYAFLDDPDKYIKSVQASKASSSSSSSSSSSKSSSSNDTTGDEITFTLPKANDPNYKGFGQKLVDLGLATSKGLWGPDGDVAFYTKQLHDQGIYGNLPIGVPIKLKKRKVK